MTRENAIDLLDNLTGMVEDNHNSDYDTALQMAIKALEQEPCEDAISRQAVLKIFSYVMDYWAEHAIDVEPHEIKDAIIEQYTFTAKELSKLPSIKPQEQKTRHWIPVSERLPEECIAVLIWCPERKNIYCAYLEERQWWIFGAYFQKVPLEVIAWMPLPETYKAESEEI